MKDIQKNVQAGASLSAKRQAVYTALRLRGRWHGLPREAYWWKRVLEVTNGLGIRPQRAPDGSWYELEEFQIGVPYLLRNYRDGEAPDVVAAWLGFEYVEELYSALAYTSSRISEAGYYAGLAEDAERDQEDHDLDEIADVYESGDPDYIF